MLILDSQNRPLLTQTQTEPVRARRSTVHGRRRPPLPAPADGRFLGRSRTRTPRPPQGEVGQRLQHLARPGAPTDREVGVRLDHLLPGAGEDLPYELRERPEPRGLRLPPRVADRLRGASTIAHRVRTLLRPDPEGNVPIDRLRCAWASARLEQRGAPEAGQGILRSKSLESTLAQLVSEGTLEQELGQKVRAEVRGLFPEASGADWFGAEDPRANSVVPLQEALAVASARVARG